MTGFAKLKFAQLKVHQAGYDGFMKLLLMVAAGAAFVCGAELAEYKTVYVLPMSSGLDQFLATKLTSGSVLQVVTDPQKADVVFTDRIGEAFEQKLDELYGQKPKGDDNDSVHGSPRTTSSPLTHGRGLIFLVDRKSRNIVWSTYVKPRNSTPEEINHVAGAVANQLEKDKHPKEKAK
jgi:hypothetical protein